MKLCPRPRFLIGALVAAALALPVAALAAHGKAGLWQITVTMQMPGRNVPELSASDRAQMKAMGIDSPNAHTISVQHCMTAADVNSDALHSMQQPGAECTMSNRKTSGQTFSADVVCTGEVIGNGHVMVSYDAPEHYSGKMTFTGTNQGQPANVIELYDGKWISADCGNVGH